LETWANIMVGWTIDFTANLVVLPVGWFLAFCSCFTLPHRATLRRALHT
jgi:hypothetical protein